MTVTCAICEKLTESSKTFTCRRCRRSSLCLEHLDSEYKACSGCAAEERMRLFNNLLRQERNIRGFMRLMQFIVIFIAVFFAVKNFFYEYVPEFMKENVIFGSLYLWGGIAICGIALSALLLRSQKQKIKEIEDKIQSHKARSRYIHH